MGDRELLEAAARAAGIEIEWDARGPYKAMPGITGGDQEWNPLTDDGDALRLAVKLKLDMHFEEQHFQDETIPIVEIFHSRDDEAGVCQCEMHSLDDDPEATVRRCIVRAAAEIGRSGGEGA